MKDMKDIEIVFCAVGQQPRTTRLFEEASKRQPVHGRDDPERRLHAAQILVGGSIEPQAVGSSVVLFANETGRLENLPPNCCGIFGDFFFVGQRRPHWRSLTTEEVRKVVKWVERNRDRGNGQEEVFRVIVGEDEIAAHYRRLKQEAAAREQEWKTL